MWSMRNIHDRGVPVLLFVALNHFNTALIQRTSQIDMYDSTRMTHVAIMMEQDTRVSSSDFLSLAPIDFTLSATSARKAAREGRSAVEPP